MWTTTDHSRLKWPLPPLSYAEAYKQIKANRLAKAAEKKAREVGAVQKKAREVGAEQTLLQFNLRLTDLCPN